ncbi:MAG TPA: alpha/beta fold hydrolase [Trebonia sp.]|jgi:pimeloyl-ACP methyl ester carboxylesterase|nr:alpha/beta fold hydrolase [Trebonia sp.]
MSTPTSLELPEGTRRATIETARGSFAALDAVPAAGPCELGTALLVPGYTGSKEDFIAILGQLSAAGRRVVAIDLRGQYQTPGPDDPAVYDTAALGADVTAVADATAASHLLGHSFGGLVARAAVLDGYSPASLTLLSSGPAALPGPRAGELHSLLAYLDGTPTADLKGKVAEMWYGTLKRQAVKAGLAAPVVAFLEQRMLANNPTGLVTMAAQLLKAEDRTDDLAARSIPTFVLYGEDDNAWPTTEQRDMAGRLNAERTCIPAAAHNPNVEAPATTAHALTTFWNAAER